MGQDWSEGVSFILPDFFKVDKIMDKIEQDNAEAVLIVPVWPHKNWWQRANAGAWRARVAAAEILPPHVLWPYNEHSFFGSSFTTGLLVMRTAKREQPRSST